MIRTSELSRLEHLNFGHLRLFRISDFVLRVLNYVSYFVGLVKNVLR
jgi:hypothetical protein